MRNNKSKTCFEDFDFFDSENFKRYQNRLLIRELAAILDEKGDLTPQDLKTAADKCRVLIQQDLELVSKKWCLLRQSGNHSLNTSKCCLAQLGDAGALKRYAVELAHNMKSYLILRLYDQPEDKRLQIRDHLKLVFQTKSQEEIPSGDRSTFFEVFQLLGIEMFFLDEGMSGDDFKLKPALESFLNELGPRIILKINNYYEYSSLGYDECQICNSCWVEESDIKNFSFLPCMKTPEKLESFWAESFRRTFYAELRDYLPDIDRFLSDDGKMNFGD